MLFFVFFDRIKLTGVCASGRMRQDRGSKAIQVQSSV